MIKRREFIQYVGVGGFGMAVGLGVHASAASPQKNTPPLQTCTFETMTVNRRGQETSRRQHTAQCFTESVGFAGAFTMMAIPGGSYVMGTSKTEGAGLAQRQPQRRVQFQPFFMGQHQVTQVQWAEVATWPKVDRELPPEPAYFRGPELPVESVSWHSASEFCARLASHTGRRYRLPSEAEWEYACRAGTTTPFHCGDTLTSQLANYVGPYTYAAEPLGAYRQTTTPVGSFMPNAFGLYDMHGNVWEWSADHWHETYVGARADGKAWVIGGNRHWRAIRGGSWSDAPATLCAGVRAGNAADSLSRILGVRVCCDA